jgi:uncharacterized damage-inducible protein DinB
MSRLEWITAMHALQYRHVWAILRDVSDEELDWRIHEQANTMRWIVSHLLYAEQWTADMIHERGQYHTNSFPATYARESIDRLHADFDEAVAETHAAIATLVDGDLSRQVELIRSPTMSTNYALPLLAVLNNHVTHIAGHLYQLRLIRGTYARAHGTDKAAFDPW